ncbi:hypothetical protein ABT282_08040 [Streptomyces sp. NPDC000927]|uniref:hypothetical protein n=1 Tax=Streptomyces sp. NPDC000927 TaxID=3154371 RepID=UPI003324C6DE
MTTTVGACAPVVNVKRGQFLVNTERNKVDTEGIIGLEDEHPVLPHTQVEDWIVLMDDLTDEEFRVYTAMRGTRIEKASHLNLKGLTMAQWCAYLPRKRRKDVLKERSSTAVRDIFASLAKKRMIVRTNPDRLNESPRYAIRRTPPRGYEGWLGCIDKASTVMNEGAETSAPPKSGHTPGGAESSAPGNELSAPGAESLRRPPGLACENGPSKKREDKKSSSKKSRAAASAPSGREEDSASASNPAGAGASRNSLKTVQGPSQEARMAAASLNGVPLTAVLEVAEEIDAALGRGWVRDDVLERLRATRWAAIRDPRGFVGGKLSAAPSAVSVGPVRGVSGSELVQYCLECRDTSGWLEDERGVLVGKCDHFRLVNCPDCLGGGLLEGRRRCGHGRAPERPLTVA